MRIDKFLWAVRLCKTRSIATEMCHTGKIRIGKEIVKAAKEIKTGDEISVHKDGINYTYRILDIPKSRVGAALVNTLIEDRTSPEETEKLLLRQSSYSFERRERGSSRPTKKDRREIDQFKDWSL